MGIMSRPEIAGRKPLYGNLGTDLGQGPSKKTKTGTSLQEDMNQSGGKKGNGGRVPKLQEDMGQ